MQPFSCQHRVHYISKMNYEITVVILQKIFIVPNKKYKDDTLTLNYC
jgi:hypothetical protein